MCVKRKKKFVIYTGLRYPENIRLLIDGILCESKMDVAKNLRVVCDNFALLMSDPAVVNELQGCARWIDDYDRGSLTMETLIEACLKRLSEEISQQTRELILDLLKIQYREKDTMKNEPSDVIIEEVGQNEVLSPRKNPKEPKSALEMSRTEWIKAWNDNSKHVNGVRAMYRTFKNETTAAIARTQMLVQCPDPPEPIEKINTAMEDVAAALESFSAMLAQRK